MLRSGSSDPYGFWNTGCMRRRSLKMSARDIPTADCPSMNTSPEVGFSSCSSIFATVDLPEPDSPTSASVLPRWIVKDTSSTARNCSERSPPVRIE